MYSQEVRLPEESKRRRVPSVIKGRLKFFKEGNDECQRLPRTAYGGHDFLTERCDSGSPPASQLAFPALPPTANICHFHTQGKAQLKNFAQTTHTDTSTC